jgi:hypothetical protein
MYQILYRFELSSILSNARVVAKDRVTNKSSEALCVQTYAIPSRCAFSTLGIEETDRWRGVGTYSYSKSVDVVEAIVHSNLN